MLAHPTVISSNEAMTSAQTTKILIIEDDPNVVTMLQHFFESRGMVVDAIDDGRETIDAVHRFTPDVILLDLILPNRDGIEVLKDLRQSGQQTPVIILTEKRKVNSKVLGLELGADDYLTKPFSLKELMARINAVLRRTQPRRRMHIPHPIRLGDLTINPLSREVDLSGILSVPLTKTEFDLFYLFASRKNEVIRRSELLQDVLGYAPDSETKALAMHIGNLRRKLKATRIEFLTIEAVPGVGYKLVEKH